MKLSDYIRVYRHDHNLSLRALAEQCGYSFQYLSKLENDQIQNPSIDALTAIAEGTEVTIHDLLLMIDDIDVALEDRQRRISRMQAVVAHEKLLLEKELNGEHIEPSEHVVIVEDADEAELLACFRRLSNEQRSAILTMMKGMMK